MRSGLLMVVMVVSVSFGCTPSTERVCARKMKLSEDRFGKLDPISHKAGFRHCVELANEERRRDPKGFKCRGNCLLDARHLDELAECDKSCAGAGQ